MTQGALQKVDRRRQPQLPRNLVGRRHLQTLKDFMQQIGMTDQALAHGNRKLFMDDLVIAHLLAFFNPVVRSLRMMEDLSQTPVAQAHLSLDRLPRSTLSDVHAVCDPAVLHPILQHLTRALPDSPRRDADLADITRRILAVDASYFTALADLHWALRKRRSNGKPSSRVALHVHLDIDDGSPRDVQVTGRGPSEANTAIGSLRADTIYLFDRGYVSFDLIRAALGKGSDLVLRLTTQTHVADVRELPLSQADTDARVTDDHLVTLCGCDKSDPPAGVFRQVLIHNPDEPDKPVRLLTSLLDLPAWQIALLYQKRWQVELFFRWLKVYAHFDHLLSHSRSGVMLSFYVASIGVLLLCLHYERRPSKYDMAMLAMVANGGATLDDIAPILAERHRQSERDRIARAKRMARNGRTRTALR